MRQKLAMMALGRNCKESKKKCCSPQNQRPLGLEGSRNSSKPTAQLGSLPPTPQIRCKLINWNFRTVASSQSYSSRTWNLQLELSLFLSAKPTLWRLSYRATQSNRRKKWWVAGFLDEVEARIKQQRRQQDTASAQHTATVKPASVVWSSQNTSLLTWDEMSFTRAGMLRSNSRPFSRSGVKERVFVLQHWNSGRQLLVKITSKRQWITSSLH